MALIVGGVTVTGTQVLDATKLSGNLPAISGASLTGVSAGWVKLAETNITGATGSVEFTDATTGVFDGTYRTNVVLITRLAPSTANRTLTLQMRDASDTNYETSSYAYSTKGVDSSNNNRSDTSTSAGGIITLGSGDGMGAGSAK